jgi:hypothetical protein
MITVEPRYVAAPWHDPRWSPLAPQAAAIYARISSDPDGTRMAITRQIDDCRAFAQRRRWQVADVYVDYADLLVMPTSSRTSCPVGVNSQNSSA